MSRNSIRAQREERRLRVAEHMASGLNYGEIARMVGCSPATVCRDAKHVIAMWRENSVGVVDDWVQLQVRRMDVSINAIWGRVLDGDVSAIGQMQKLIDQQGRMLGFEQAAELIRGKLEIEDAGLSDEERAARITAIFDRARARRAGQTATDGGDGP